MLNKKQIYLIIKEINKHIHKQKSIKYLVLTKI